MTHLHCPTHLDIGQQRNTPLGVQDRQDKKRGMTRCVNSTTVSPDHFLTGQHCVGCTSSHADHSAEESKGTIQHAHQYGWPPGTAGGCCSMGCGPGTGTTACEIHWIHTLSSAAQAGNTFERCAQRCARWDKRQTHATRAQHTREAAVYEGCRQKHSTSCNIHNQQPHKAAGVR